MPCDDAGSCGNPEFDETLQTLEHLQRVLENLLVRGLNSAGPQELKALSALEEELGRIGAGHLAGKLRELRQCIETDPPAAAPVLLQTQASLRVFERILTLESAAEALARLAQGDKEDA